jgi:flagellar basal-body rod modification protein FlgD
MAISAVTSTNPTSTANATNGTNKNTLDKNTFLKLFTTQLQYQDPLNPMDASSFTTQLAQFSSLEQLYNTNDNLKTLISTQNSLLPTLSANLIGKKVTLNDGSTAKIAGISFDGTNTKLVLDNKNTVALSDIKNISS